MCAHTSSPISYSNMSEPRSVLAWKKKQCGLFLRNNVGLYSAFVFPKLIHVSVTNLSGVPLRWVIILQLPLGKVLSAC